MPTPYDLVTNQRLRELVQKSASIQSLGDEQKQAMIERIAQLPPEGQQEMIALLEEEAAAINSGKILSPEAKQKMMEEGMRKMTFAKKDMKKKILVEGEKVEVEQSNLIANQLLQKL